MSASGSPEDRISAIIFYGQILHVIAMLGIKLTGQTGHIVCQQIEGTTRRRTGRKNRGGKDGGREEKCEANPTEQGLHDEERM